MYFAKLGINTNAPMPRPSIHNTLAPGQCCKMKREESTVNEHDNAPEMNVNVFIFLFIWSFD